MLFHKKITYPLSSLENHQPEATELTPCETVEKTVEEAVEEPVSKDVQSLLNAAKAKGTLISSEMQSL